MIRVRRLTDEGLQVFRNWLEASTGLPMPNALIDGEAMTEIFGEFEIDPTRSFSSRLEFGEYLVERFADARLSEMVSPACDGVWAWLAAVYFSQLTAKGRRRSEHYVVTRKGAAGSLAYRHAVRTPYQLVYVHGSDARICLNRPMSTHGELTEQLTSRQRIALHRGFFQTASYLYMNNGGLKRGAASKPKNPRHRTPGDRTGFGGIRRLAIALQRLDLTFDTEIMNCPEMLGVLPKEFAKWRE